MTERKTKVDVACYGIIGKEKKEMCNHCDFSEPCGNLKQDIANKITSAKEKGRSDYIKQQAEATSTAIGKFLAYGLTIAILVFLFWQVSKEV